jgi:hypothetical protein
MSDPHAMSDEEIEFRVVDNEDSLFHGMGLSSSFAVFEGRLLIR